MKKENIPKHKTQLNKPKNPQKQQKKTKPKKTAVLTLQAEKS